MQKMGAANNLIISVYLSIVLVGGMVVYQLLDSPATAALTQLDQAAHPTPGTPADRQQALNTVDYLTEIIPTISHLCDQVTNYALVGEILWRYDQARARDYFRTAFSTIDRITVSNGSKLEDPAEKQR